MGYPVPGDGPLHEDPRLITPREHVCNSAHGLAAQIYPELRALAETHMKHERADHSLQATALVHEAFLRLCRTSTPLDRLDPSQFYALASETIRHVLVDHARRRNALKRGGDWGRVPIDLVAPSTAEAMDDEIVRLDEALACLAALAERPAQVVELRFFGCLTMPEIADLLGVSRKTVAADWAYARAWLARALEDD